MNAKSVYDMLQRKGIDATVRTYPNAEFNPSTNQTTSLEPVDHTIKIIPPYKNKEGYKPHELITSGKGLTGIASYNLQFTVKAGLKLIISSKEWTVISYTDIKNNTGILLYLLEIESDS
jgi:hypothetical protein